MAQYTLTIKQIMENNLPIFDFDYPIFNEEYRSVLEEKIIRHYYFREIGFETFGRFRFELKTKLNEIMPYYNQLYQSTLLEFDPLINYEVKESYERKTTGVNNGESNSQVTDSQESKGTSKYSDTPQGRINFDDSSHITALTQNEGESSSSSQSLHNQTQSNEGSEEFSRTMRGNIGVQTFSQLLNDYRKTFINVDLMVIEELGDLFLRVY